MEVLHGRRGHACDGVRVDAPLDGFAAIDVCASSAVTRLTSPIYGTDRKHVFANRHVFLDEVDLFAVQSFYVEDNGCLTQASWLAHESLDAPSVGHRPARRNAAAGVAPSPLVARASTGDTCGHASQGARCARESLAPSGLCSIRCFTLTATGRKRSDVLPLPDL